MAETKRVMCGDFDCTGMPVVRCPKCGILYRYWYQVDGDDSYGDGTLFPENEEGYPEAIERRIPDTDQSSSNPYNEMMVRVYFCAACSNSEPIATEVYITPPTRDGDSVLTLLVSDPNCPSS